MLFNLLTSTTFANEGEASSGIQATMESSSDLLKGLVAHYPFDGDVQDISGNGNHGTINEDVKFVSAVKGMGLKLGGVHSPGGTANPDYVLVKNSPSLQFTDSMTVSYFVRIDGTQAQTGKDCSGGIIDEIYGNVLRKSGDNPGFYFFEWDTMSDFGVDIFKGGFRMRTGGSDEPDDNVRSEPIELDSGQEPLPSLFNTFRHVVYAISDNTIRLYINGILKNTLKTSVSFDKANAQDMYIGVQKDESCLKYWYPLEGVIDELRIYNRALNDNEVSLLFKEDSSSAKPPAAPTTTITTDVESRITTGIPPSVIHPDLGRSNELCKHSTDNSPLVVTNVVRTEGGKRALFEITVTDPNALNYFDIIPENGKIKYAAQVIKPGPTGLDGFVQDQFLILSAAFQDIVGLAAETISPFGPLGTLSKFTGTYFQIGEIVLKNENKDDHRMGLPNGVYWVLMEGDDSGLLPDLELYAVFNQDYCYNGRGAGFQTIYEGLNRYTFSYKTTDFSQVRYILGLDIGEVTSPPKVELKDNFWSENPIVVSEMTWSGKNAYFVIKVKKEYSGPKVGSITVNTNPGLVEYVAKIEDTDSQTKTMRDMTNLGCALATDLAAFSTGNLFLGTELAALGVMAQKILPNSDNPHEVIIANDLAVSGSYIVKIKAEDNGITPNPLVFVSPVKIAIAVVSRADAANAEAGIPQNSELVQNRLYWSFDKGLDGWERTGSVPPWHTMESAIQWYDQWGGAQGVIVIDACESTPNGYQEVHAKGGIKKSVTLPQDAEKIIFNIVRVNHDGGIRFLLSDSEGQHTLGEEVLSGAITKQLSYDISAWKDKEVTLEVQTFGAGTDDSGCIGSGHGCGSCCGEYTGIDWVAI